MESEHIQDQSNLQKMQRTPTPVRPEPSRPQAEQSRDTLPQHIEELHMVANDYARDALNDAINGWGAAETLRTRHMLEERALRRFQLAEHLRRLATRLTVEQVTEGDG